MTDPDSYRGKFAIVVGRQYGSGGRLIAEMLAKRLGASYYDKTLLSRAAESLGYSPDIFMRHDERRPSFMRSLLSFAYGSEHAGVDGDTMSQERIYEFQSHVIKEICARESCVIVGRTADYVMRHHPGLVSIFVHAPIEKRIERIIARGETSDHAEARELARNTDSARRDYYEYYTSRKWGDGPNYHLSFDSSRLDDDRIVSLLEAIILNRQPR